MNEFNSIYISSDEQPKNKSLSEKQHLSFIPNMNDLLKGKPKKVATKKVNTKVPKQVLTTFWMYCIQDNRFRKEVFSDILEQFLEKHKKQPLLIIDNVQGVTINFEELEEANFEFDIRLFPAVQELKVINRITFIEIYTQAIVHFFNDHLAD